MEEVKQTELERLCIILRNEYGLTGLGHYEITAATKENDCWLLTVQEMKTGAENESN
jgi:hypothetical protein